MKKGDKVRLKKDKIEYHTAWMGKAANSMFTIVNDVRPTDSDVLIEHSVRGRKKRAWIHKASLEVCFATIVDAMNLYLLNPTKRVARKKVVSEHTSP